MNNIIYAGRHPLTFSVLRHAHTGWEFVYCTGGKGAFVFDDFTMEYQEGDVVIIPPHIPHSNSGSEGFCNIHINMLNPKLTLKTPALIHDDVNKFILNAFSASFFHFNRETRQRAALLSAYGDIISCYIVSNREETLHSEVVEDIESEIIRSYNDCNFELDKYLHSLPFSYDYLRKLFRKEIGITPHQYLRDKRLQTAAETLSLDCGKSNIHEVARMCGFREALYFSRMFRKKYGVSPRAYQTMRRDVTPNDTKIIL